MNRSNVMRRLPINYLVPCLALGILWSQSFAETALAHPGHGDADASPIVHYLATPEHSVPCLMLAMILVALASLWLRAPQLEKS